MFSWLCKLKQPKEAASVAYAPPPQWAKDNLSEYFETAYRNRHATFVRKPKEYELLQIVDGCFLTVTYDWRNPDHILASQLLVRCHSSFRVAVENALAGQVVEVNSQLRSALEYAAYAAHMKLNAGLDEIWLRRHDDDESLKRVKNKFTIANVKKSVKKCRPDCADPFDELYQRTIDFGGHPNELAFTSSLNLVEQPDSVTLQQIQLQGDGLPLDLALRSSAQVGVCVLLIYESLFPERFKDLGVGETLTRLRQYL